jgi:hypothetical protein
MARAEVLRAGLVVACAISAARVAAADTAGSAEGSGSAAAAPVVEAGPAAATSSWLDIAPPASVGSSSGSGSGAATGSAAPEATSYKLTGYIEAYYGYNFNRPSNLITAFRGFDNHTNSFTIENAVLDFTGSLGKVSVHIALQDGHTPAAYYSQEPNTPAESGVGASNADLWRLIQQALIAYKASDKLMFDAGIFLDPIGPESLAIKDQWNWSRSDLFYALPFYHAGVRAAYAITDKLTGEAFITNGWNDIVNSNPYPCIAGQLTYTTPTLTIAGSYFGGIEPPTGSPEGQPWRHLFDLTGIWKASDDWSFAAQANAGFENNPVGTSSWIDGAAYARYQLSKRFYTAGRVDAAHEHDAENATNTIPRLFFPADDVQSATATLGLQMTGNLTLMLEYRYDHSSTPMFYEGTVLVGGPKNLALANTTFQDTLTLGAVGWF